MTTAQDSTIECSRCSTSNNQSNRFCTACAAPLGAEWQAWERIIDDRLAERIRQTLKDEFRDQKALEIETTEKIADRTVRWAKIFGFFVGLPVAVIIAILWFIGVKTWSDVSAAREKVTTVTADLSSAQKQLGEVNTRTKEAMADADSLKHKVDEAREQLAAIPDLQRRTSNLEATIKNFVAEGGKPIEPEKQSKIDATVDGFKSYILTMGVSFPTKLPTFTMESSDKTGMISSYDLRTYRITIDPDAIDDPDYYLREFSHLLLLSKLDVPEVSKNPPHSAYRIESAISMVLACEFFK
jgi:hypothetical protein